MSTVKDLILKLKNSNPIQILAETKNPGERGVVYEALWNIVIKFNCLPGISILEHNNSNLQNQPKIPLKDFEGDFLNKPFRSGSVTGFCDIGFKDTENFYLSTSKYFENDKNKLIDDWELTKLTSLHVTHGVCKHLVFTKNKESFLKVYKNSHKNDTVIFERVYDLHDLVESMEKVVKILDIYNWNFDKLLQYHFGKQKRLLDLLFHQQLCLYKTARMNRNHAILWGLKCRSGKSYIMAGHIHRNKFTNVLIITPIPNESIKSLVKLFKEHIEFDDYQVIHYQRGTKLPVANKKIIIASKQYLDGKVIPCLQNITFDAVYYDENHWGGTTDNSNKIVSTYVKHNHTQFVVLTATYSKSRQKWNIPESQSFFWDLEDESLCKQNNIAALIEKFQIEVPNDISSQYAEMPILKLLTIMFDPTFIANFKQFNTDDSYSFDITTLLKCENGEFVNKNKVRELLDYHFGNGYNNGKNMRDRIAKSYDTRTGKEFHTQLWFLPYGAGNNLNQTAKCLEQLINQHKYGKNYAVEILTSENDNSEKGNLYEYIEALENKAIKDGKEGLILLLGFKCSMGISLPRADVVVMLNNGYSMDMYMQMIMRCMTEHRGHNKKYGFVIEYNQKRVLETTLNIVRGISFSREDIERALNVVHIDEDMIVNDKTQIVNKIYEIYKKSKINRIDLMYSRLEQLTVSFDTEDNKKISCFIKNSTIVKNTREQVEVNSEDEKLPDAMSVVSSNSSDNNMIIEDEENDKIDYSKEIITSIPMLAGLLTDEHKNMVNFIECLEFIKNNEELHSIFIGRCQLWWEIKNPNGFIDFLIYLTKKYYLNILHSINNEIRTMKDTVSMIDSKKEKLDMLNSMLKIKVVEKKKNGEVFTPFELIEGMLSQLPKEVWENPNLKWFDPCVGVGNFMVCVYYRLFEGLKDKIEDEEEREKHIIENMLYMSETNSKNIFVCKRMFLGHEINIHQGDTLEFNIPHKFDVIVGNPPYNASGDTATGNTIWQNFTKKAINEWLAPNGYLVFVHPPGWRKPNTPRGKFYKMFDLMAKENQMLYLSIHSLKDGSSTFKCGTRYDWYVMQKTPKYKNTQVKDELGNVTEIDLSKLNWLPNYNIDVIDKILAKDGDEKCELIYSPSAYEHRKAWMSHTQTGQFKYPCVHSTPKNGVRYMYSSKNDNGHFGIPKVIFGETGIYNAIIDIEGKYGLTNGCIAIRIDNQENGEKYKACLESEKMTNIIKSCSFSSFRVDWNVFKDLKKDFWNYL